MLLVSLREAGVKNFSKIGLAVTICIFGIKQIRCRSNEDSFFPGDHTTGERNLVEEQRRTVVSSVVIRIFQKSNPTTGCSTTVDPQRIIRHFGNPQLAIGAPVERDRIHRQRFVRDEFDLISRQDSHRLDRGIGRLGHGDAIPQQIVERDLPEQIWQGIGFFIDPAKLPILDEKAVFRAIRSDNPGKFV